ncbi:hypothetical protein GCM10028807_27560 [Spirosoma daeguense]
MKSLSTPFLFILLGIFTLVLSCKKEESQPTPTTPLGNAITANPAVTGLASASVIADASGSAYTITVPAGTDVKTLKISIPITTGSKIDPDPTIARDYTNPVTYTITKTDGTKQTVTVKVVVLAAPKSSEKQITAFSFAALSPVVTASIDQNTRKVAAIVPSTTDITKLVPTITTSAKANLAPASGVVQNYTNPVSYTVTAEDGSTLVYEVKVEKSAVVPNSTPCLLTQFEDTYTTSSGSSRTDITNFGYDQTGRINQIKRTSSGSSASTLSISYDTDGNVVQVIEAGSGSSTTRFSYQNGKVTKMEIYDASNKLVGDYIASSRFKFNDQNEPIESNSNPGQTTNEKTTFGYLNGNIVRITGLWGDNREPDTFEYSYDTKNNPLLASKPQRILLVYLIRYSSFGMANNIVQAKNTKGQTGTITYTYNKNNYPIDAKAVALDGTVSTYKYTYSNCQ